MDCYRHPGVASTATCVACAQPICPDCRDDVAGSAMCRSCVAVASARLSAQTNPAAEPSFDLGPGATRPVQTMAAPAVALQGGPGATALDSTAPGIVRRIG